MARALLKRRREIGAGRGSGARALMVILGWSGETASRITLGPLRIDETLQRSGAPVGRIAEWRRQATAPGGWCAPGAVMVLLRCRFAHIRCETAIRRDLFLGLPIIFHPRFARRPG